MHANYNVSEIVVVLQLFASLTTNQSLLGNGPIHVHYVFRRDASICIARISYGNVSVSVAGWLAGWLSVCHSRYCIKMAKLILKLFRPSGSPII